MNNRSTCPEPDVLNEFLAGKLEEDQIAQLERHLIGCDACGDTVRALHVEDTLVGLVREVGNAGSEATLDDEDSNQLSSLLRDLESLAGSNDRNNDPDLRNRVHEVEALLRSSDTGDGLGELAHYKILKLLGAGGMGVVYQASDRQLERLVALKILRPSLGRPARERFLREARAAAAIEHDHVVTIYDVGDEGPLAFLAMPWIEGETLESRLQTKGHLKPEKVIEIGCQVAAGLAAAHAKKLIHRDIKPANIWLESSRERARILDFGLAQVVDDNPQLTETGMIAGTPAYMSPEQAQGRAVDERSDLFSLGTMLYRMLTGQLPFESDNALATIQAIQQNSPPTPRQLDMGIPAWLSDTVMALLEKDPRARPATATDVVEYLTTGQAPPLVNSRSVSPSPLPASRRRIPMGLALVLALAGILGAFAVYRVVTDRGTIVIETMDPSMLVDVRNQKTGELVVIDPSTKDRVTIRSGSYVLSLQEPNSQVTIKPKAISLVRDAEEVITISEVGRSADAEPMLVPEEVSSTDLPEPRRNGRIRPGSAIHIQVVGVDPEWPIDAQYVVEPAGTVALGAMYGRIHISGKTVEEAESAIAEKLHELFNSVFVQVTESPSDTELEEEPFPQRLELISLEFADAAEVQQTFFELFPEVGIAIVVGKEKQSLMVKGTDREIEVLRTLIRQVDIPSKSAASNGTGRLKPWTVPADFPPGVKLYDGKPYEYWHTLLGLEQNPRQQLNALSALKNLGTDATSAATSSAVFRAMRSPGLWDMFEAEQTSMDTLRTCHPDDVRKAFLTELTDENFVGRSFYSYFLRQISANASPDKKILQNFNQHSYEICQAILSLQGEGATQLLAIFCANFELSDKAKSSVIPKLQSLFAEREETLLVAKALARNAPQTEGLVAEMIQVIQRQAPTFTHEPGQLEEPIMILGLLGPAAESAVPVLSQVLPYWANPPDGRATSINGGHPYGAAVVINALGAIGPGAREALPLLRKYTPDGIDDQGFGVKPAAKAAIKKIEVPSNSED